MYICICIYIEREIEVLQPFSPGPMIDLDWDPAMTPMQRFGAFDTKAGA